MFVDWLKKTPVIRLADQIRIFQESMDFNSEFSCTLTCETLSMTGEVQKRTVHRDAILMLGRNEFRDVILNVCLGKQKLDIHMKDIVIHRKFAKEGKATIAVTKPKMNLMLSNCPPDKLFSFLKTLTIKVECLKQKGTTFSERERLTSVLPRTFQEISPVSVKDITILQNQLNKIQDPSATLETPKRKRKLDESAMDKENSTDFTQSVANPVKRKLCSTKIENGKVLPLQKPILQAIVLSKEQQQVLSSVLSGKSLFFTGSAGTGKSFLLRRIIGALPPEYTFATASTGLAACHIGGTTVHAFAGIGSGKGDLEQCVQLASRPAFKQQWKQCQHLIIDEISMLDGELFDKLEVVARTLRKSDKPFGGIQLILCGDFLQLPPVTRFGEKRIFAFQSKAWRKCVGNYILLKEVRRQSDQKFVQILNNIRIGRCTQEMEDCLRSTSRHKLDQNGILATRLCTHKDDVDNINKLQLVQLTANGRIFKATDSQPSMSSAIDNLCSAVSVIELKEGAQVTLLKNIDIQKGLVNGARGVVVGFEPGIPGYPIVKFVSGEQLPIGLEKWNVKGAGGMALQRKQLPLKLAWALSIHKSQGMTLDCVEISLSRVFESGQAYVALSRAKNLEGLRIIDFDRSCVRADPIVLRFYEQLGN